MTTKNAYGIVKSSVNYYQNNRNKLDDLYDSEKYFLEKIFRNVNNILDVGCAAGGLSNVAYKLNKLIKYTGIDISPELINKAKLNYTNSDFYLYDGKSIPFSESSFDLVFSIGVLHHLQHWKEIIKQMLLISSEYVVFDLRLTNRRTLNNSNKYYQKISFDNKWDKKTKIPYIVLNENEVFKFIKDLINDNFSCEVYGYPGSPNGQATIPYGKVYFCAFCITKKKSDKSFVNNVNW